MLRISTLVIYYILSISFSKATGFPHDAVIQTDKGLRHMTDGVEKRREKRSLSTNFSSESTYPAENGLICHVCPPGFYRKADCMINGTIAVCEQCPDRQYSSSYNIAIRCALCSDVCIDKNSEIERACSNIADTKCRCKTGYYSHPKGGGEYVCLPHNRCHPGTELAIAGNFESDTQCKSCHPGTYSNQSSFTAQCRPCSVCPNGHYVQQPCDSRHDIECISEDNTVVPMYVIVLVVVSIVVVVALCVLLYLWWKGILALCCGPRECLEDDGDYKGEPLEVYTIYNKQLDQITVSDIKVPLGDNLDISSMDTLQISSMDARVEIKDESSWCELFRYISHNIRLIDDQGNRIWMDFMRSLMGSVQIYKDVTTLNNKIDEIIINYENKGVREQLYRCLLAWKMAAGDEARLHEIIMSLESNGQKDLATELKSKYSSDLKRVGFDDSYSRSQE